MKSTAATNGREGSNDRGRSVALGEWVLDPRRRPRLQRVPARHERRSHRPASRERAAPPRDARHRGDDGGLRFRGQGTARSDAIRVQGVVRLGGSTRGGLRPQTLPRLKHKAAAQPPAASEIVAGSPPTSKARPSRKQRFQYARKALANAKVDQSKPPWREAGGATASGAICNAQHELTRDPRRSLRTRFASKRASRV